jgi:hypothetical protein
MSRKRKTGITQAIEAMGTAYRLGKQLGVEQNAPYQWQRRGFAPPGYYRRIEELSGVSRLELLDDYPQK